MITLLWLFLELCSSLTLMPMAEKAAQNGDYTTSSQLLKLVNPAKDPTKYYFLKAVNAYSTNQQKEAKNALMDFEFFIRPNTPKRYIHVASLMQEKLSTWKDSDLSDIGRDMKHSANRLGSGRADNMTKKIQNDIISKLDKMIKDEEDMRNAKKKKIETDEEATRKIPTEDSSNPDSPKDESTIGGMPGDGRVDSKDFKKIAKKWGTLPDADRAKIISQIQRDIPPKFRQQIEDYQKSLNKHIK